MTFSSFQFSPHVFFLLFVVILANLRATMFVYLFPDTSVLLGPAWIEILLWFIVCVVLLHDLRRERQLGKLFVLWHKNWMLICFILFALVSASWSVDATVTLFRSIELIFATIAASVIGVRHRVEYILEVLFWFGALLLILTFASVFGAPKMAIMDWAPYNGAWRGVYWNRNHLASIFSLLNALFLLRLIIGGLRQNSRALLDMVFYLLSLVVLYFANSATGFILAVILNGCVICFWLWLKVAERMKARHYYMIAGFSIAGVVLVFANLDTIFGLFGRSTSLTGRVPLWNAILNHAVSLHPWLGRGFGASWNVEAFRIEIMQAAGWVSQPLIADNGYLEILLHLGMLGLLMFLLVFCTMFIHSLYHGLKQKTLIGFYPLLVVVYALIANLTFSLFAETEVFVWFLLVTGLFVVTPQRSELVTS